MLMASLTHGIVLWHCFLLLCVDCFAPYRHCEPGLILAPNNSFCIAEEIENKRPLFTRR
jgi:hypothetical protein